MLVAVVAPPPGLPADAFVWPALVVFAALARLPAAAPGACSAAPVAPTAAAGLAAPVPGTTGVRTRGLDEPAPAALAPGTTDALARGLPVDDLAPVLAGAVVAAGAPALPRGLADLAPALADGVLPAAGGAAGLAILAEL